MNKARKWLLKKPAKSCPYPRQPGHADAPAGSLKPTKETRMYPKMTTPKKKVTPVTVMVAIGKPKPLPKRGQRATTNKMTRGKK